MFNKLRDEHIKLDKHVMDFVMEIGSSLKEEYEDVKIEFEVNKKDDDEEQKPPKQKGKKGSKKRDSTRKLDVTVARDARFQN